MAKSYYILKAKQIAGTTESDAKYEIVPECTKVTDNVSKLFYTYLLAEMGTMPFFNVNKEIEDLRSASSRTVKTVLGILVGKVGGYDRLGGFISRALEKLNADIKADTENGTGGLSSEEYAEFYSESKRPRHSHWVYFRAKDYARENEIPLSKYKKSTTVVYSSADVGAVPGGTPVEGGTPVGGGTPVEGGTPVGGGTPVEGGNPVGGGTPVEGGTPVGGGTPVDGAPVVTDPTPKQDKNPAEKQDSAKFNPTAAFFREHPAMISVITAAAVVLGLAFTPGTFWATSLFSLMLVGFAVWAVTFSLMTFVPGLKHAKQREMYRSKIDNCSTKSNSHVSESNNYMNIALKQAGITLCDLQIAVLGEGADKEAARRKISAALGSCNKSKVLRAIENSKRELQNAINQLYSTNSKGVVVGALRHQEELYDEINARRNMYERAGRVAKVQKYDRMPVALRNYIATYARCEQAVIEINRNIEYLRECGLDVEKPHFENWDTVKEKTRKYYAGALNSYYEEFHYERDGKPLRINSAGERIKEDETPIAGVVTPVVGGGTPVVVVETPVDVIEVSAGGDDHVVDPLDDSILDS